MGERRGRKCVGILILLCVMAVLFVAGCGEKEEVDTVDRSKIAVEVVSESTMKEEPEPEVKTLTLTAVGDCTLGVTQNQGYSGSFNNYYDVQGEDYFLSGVRDIFSADDLTIVNLECVLTTATERVEKTFNLKGAPEYVRILTGSSVEACVLGNNHTYDYGQEGFDETERVVEEAGLTYAYSGKSGIYVSEEGVKVGIVSASLISESTEKLEEMKSEIAVLQAGGADVILACCHWGIETEHNPTSFQQTAAHELIDAGADLIIGHHPHVLQSVEVYHGKVILYSLGNFCFGGNLNPSDKNSMIYQQTFTIVDGELQTDTIDARIIPCRISSTDSHNDFHPIVATGDRKTEILDFVNEYSATFGTASFDEEGTLRSSE